MAQVVPCYKPLRGYRVGDGPVVFSFVRNAQILDLPCGRCRGCRLEKSRQWGVRIMHEAKLHDRNCFVTLTYDEKNLPSDLSVSREEFQKFMKRLRKRFEPERIRYYACGEYGEKLDRPHYHACLFNVDFEDKVVLESQQRDDLFVSDVLASAWPLGFHSIGELTFESACYVARYCVKKVTGPKAKEHYMKVDTTTGEVFELEPEFALMSRRPGIGQGHIEKYLDDVFPSDECVVNGHPTKPPRYYDKFFESVDPEGFAEVKERRLKAGEKNLIESWQVGRLRQKERVKERQLGMLRRRIEE